MPSQPIAKTDGSVSFLDMFLCIVGWVNKGSNVRKCRLKYIQLYRLESTGLKALLNSSQPDVPKEKSNPKVWMPFQTIAKTDGSVVVLATFLCFVRWGAQRFKCTEMSA